MSGVLAWVALVACYYWWRGLGACVADMLACLRGWHGCRASVGSVLTWVTWLTC